MRLHKYLYDNASPVSNSDPTGYFSLVGIIGGSKARAELDSITTPNYAGILGYLLRKISTFAIEIIKRVITVYLIDILIDFTIDATVGEMLENAIEDELQIAWEKGRAHELYEDNYVTHEHHIVAQGDKRALASVSILLSVGLNIESEHNIVTVHAAFHWHLHTDEYHNLVFARLFIVIAPSIDESVLKQRFKVIGALKEIKTIIQNMNRTFY